MSDNRLARRLDWNQLLGFQNIPECRADRTVRGSHQLNAKAGVKPGLKVGLKTGVKT